MPYQLFIDTVLPFMFSVRCFVSFFKDFLCIFLILGFFSYHCLVYLVMAPNGSFAETFIVS